MIKKIMNWRLITLIFLLSGASSAEAQNAIKSYLPGKWVLDTLQSNFGKAPHWAMFNEINVNLDEDSLIVSRTSKKQNGQMVTRIESIPLNGDEKRLVTLDKRAKKVNFRWSLDKEMFAINSLVSVPEHPDKNAYSSEEFWSMATDNESLIVQLTVHNPKGGQYTINGVFKRYEKSDHPN